MKWLRYIYFVLFACCMAAWFTVEYTSIQFDPRGMLQVYRIEYAHGGSMKWRTPEGRSFRDFLMTYGVPTYPLTIVGIVAGFGLARRSQTKTDRITFFVMTALLVALLLRFMQLGILGAAMEI